MYLFITSLLISAGTMCFLKPIFGGDECRPYGQSGIPFYPKDAESLKASVEKGFKDAIKKEDIPKDEFVVGYIAPHAGYDYAGKLIAAGCNYLKDKNIKRVIILGFSHRYYSALSGTIDVGDWDFVSTPLGKIPVDKDAVKDFLKNPPFVSKQNPAQNIEWSTENQIPFLQTALKDFKVVILLVGDIDEKNAEKAAIVLRRYMTPDTAFVVSSDFTHYGPMHDYVPFKDNLKENLYKLDGGAIDEIIKGDYNGFRDYINKTGATICGRDPISLFLKVIENQDVSAKKLDYMTSGDLDGNYARNSVGYASILFTKKFPKIIDNKKAEPAAEKTPAGVNLKQENNLKEERFEMKNDSDIKKNFREELFGPDDENEAPILNEEEKKTLMQIARDMLNNCTKDKKYHPDFSKFSITENLKIPCRVFVTLKIDEDLRGCIGFSQAEYPLAEAVVKSTFNSCYKDPRFPAVRSDEAKKIRIDISVNTKPKLATNGYKDITLGKHGIYLVKWQGGYPAIATFLPMVATEQGWTLEETLSHLSMKARLPKNAWQEPDTEFYLYTSQVINEQE